MLGTAAWTRSSHSRSLSSSSERLCHDAVVLRWFALVVAMVLATVIVAGSSAAAGKTAPRVRVVRCPTSYGVAGELHKTPSRLAVLHDPVSTRGLVAYTNTDIYLIAPAGMRCAGIIGADGTTALAVGPRALTAELNNPGRSYSGIGLTLAFDPDCVSCEASDLCPFFAQSARAFGFPCTTGIPADEQTYRLTPQVTLFEDPPGIRGDGWPSGGPDPANGLVGFTGPPRQPDTTVYRSTCTLPTSEHSICTVSLNDTLSRYG
jgi:hypothetical protein